MLARPRWLSRKIHGIDFAACLKNIAEIAVYLPSRRFERAAELAVVAGHESAEESFKHAFVAVNGRVFIRNNCPFKAAENFAVLFRDPYKFRKEIISLGIEIRSVCFKEIFGIVSAADVRVGPAQLIELFATDYLVFLVHRLTPHERYYSVLRYNYSTIGAHE